MAIWRKWPAVEEKNFQLLSLLATAKYWMYIWNPHKWRIFHRLLNVKIDFAENIIKVCGVLHNFVCERDGYSFDHILYVEGLH